MSALTMIVICERLRKGLQTRVPAMKGAELAELLNVLAFLQREA